MVLARRVSGPLEGLETRNPAIQLASPFARDKWTIPGGLGGGGLPENTADHDISSLNASSHPVEQPRHVSAAPEASLSITPGFPRRSAAPTAHPANVLSVRATPTGQDASPADATRGGRSACSVKDQPRRLELPTRFSEGYNTSHLVDVFGLPRARIKSWARRGLLGKGREIHGAVGIWFTEEAVMRFLRSHSSEYDLSKVDQVWYKAMLFGRHGVRR
jgi:hypothetical protein